MKDKFRSIDVLLLDDVQFLAGKDKTGEVFFQLFNKLFNEKKTIVLNIDSIKLIKTNVFVIEGNGINVEYELELEYDFIDEYITDRKLIPLRNELTYPSR